MSKLTSFLFGAVITYAVFMTISGVVLVNAALEKVKTEEETPEKIKAD